MTVSAYKWKVEEANRRLKKMLRRRLDATLWEHSQHIRMGPALLAKDGVHLTPKANGQLWLSILYNMDTCPNVTFHRKPEMDDLVFTGSLIEEMKQVQMRAECFSLCHWRKLCNLVLYNPLTRKCRLHSEAFGPLSDCTAETGWQYYGISCANFRLDNAHADTDVVNTAPKDVCHSNIIVADDNTSSCYTGASWDVVPVKCVSCYIGLPRKFTYPFAGHSLDVNFDLAAGMKLKLEVSGDRTR
ncbi:uncharacterized protein [Haliotis asinina]|uniref:uncharacterized protein n=1 Tax=Haliotis asinina TaxID=109174 RepID=UPI003531FC6C